jgi:hypothetical protein
MCASARACTAYLVRAGPLALGGSVRGGARNGLCVSSGVRLWGVDIHLMAAAWRMVPEPQQGSTKGTSPVRRRARATQQGVHPRAARGQSHLGGPSATRMPVGRLAGPSARPIVHGCTGLGPESVLWPDARGRSAIRPPRRP